MAGTSRLAKHHYAFLLLLTGSALHAQAVTPAPDTHVTSGAALFASSGCAHCHGATAQGGEVGPSLIDVSKRKDAAAITLQIHDGAGAMPAFGEILLPDQVTDLVSYLQTLKTPPRKAARRKRKS